MALHLARAQRAYKDIRIHSFYHKCTHPHANALSLSLSLLHTRTRTHTHTTHALQIRITKWPHHLSPAPSPAAVNNTWYAAESFATFDYFLFLCVLCCVNLEQPFSFPFFPFLGQCSSQTHIIYSDNQPVSQSADSHFIPWGNWSVRCAVIGQSVTRYVNSRIALN